MPVTRKERSQEATLAAYRVKRLMDLGLSPVNAELVAEALPQRGHDWHDVKKLLDQGCPIPTAIKILL